MERTSGSLKHKEDGVILDAEGNQLCVVLPRNKEANAKFIVRAWNSYDELLEACKCWQKLWDFREYLDDRMLPPNLIRDLYAQTHEAIAKAEMG